jgi:hypothetical protein
MPVLLTRHNLRSPRPWDPTQSRDMSGQVHMLLNVGVLTVVACMYMVGVGRNHCFLDLSS